MKSFFPRPVSCTPLTLAWWFAMGRHWQPAGVLRAIAVIDHDTRSTVSRVAAGIAKSNVAGIGDLTHFMYA